MAERKIIPKVKNDNGSYDELIFKNSENSTYATYASADISKGTIEERLTNLGFRESSVSLSSGVTASINRLTRQGNYVIGRLEITEMPTLDVYASSSSFSNDSVSLGYVPELFRPKNSVSRVAVSASIRSYPASSSLTTNEYLGNLTAGISGDGLIRVSLRGKRISGVDGYLEVDFSDIPLVIIFGYEATPI